MKSAAECDGTKRWFAVRTQPSRERLALQHLERQHFESFCPMWRGAARKARHTRAVPLAPMFPSYVFARFDLDRQRWRSINGTIGCVGLVAFGARPTPLPAGFVEMMLASRLESGEVGFEQSLSPGGRVRVIGGVFDDMCGTLLDKSGPQRVAILLEVMSRETRVEIASARLIAA